MKYPLATLLVLVSLLPAYASAQIVSNVSASSDTGGNTAAPGVVVRTGNSSASVEVHTVSGSSGTTTVHIKTEVNGQKHEETYTKPTSTIRVTARATATTTARSTVRVSGWLGKIFNFKFFGWWR